MQNCFDLKNMQKHVLLTYLFNNQLLNSKTKVRQSKTQVRQGKTGKTGKTHFKHEKNEFLMDITLSPAPLYSTWIKPQGKNGSPVFLIVSAISLTKDYIIMSNVFNRFEQVELSFQKVEKMIKEKVLIEWNYEYQKLINL